MGGNWKFAAENSMEYYHHVGLHKDTVGVQLRRRAPMSFLHRETDLSLTNVARWVAHSRPGNRIR